MIQNLTMRERLVWLGVIEGRKLECITAELGVGTTTTFKNLSSLKRKLGVKARGAGRRNGYCELVIIAARWGMI